MKMTASRWPGMILLLAFLLTGLALSLAKSQRTSARLVPRANPRGHNIYEARWYCIDGHAHWAKGLRDYVTSGGSPEARKALTSLQPANLPGKHATPFVLVGPVITAALSLGTGDIISAYHLSSLLAILLSAFLVRRTLLTLGHSVQCAELGFALLLSQYWVMHGLLALYQDPWALMVTTLLMERSVSFVRNRGWTSLLLAALVSGFTKATGMLGGVGVAGLILLSSASAGALSWRTALAASAATALVPLTALAGFILALDVQDSAGAYRSWLALFPMNPRVVIDIGLVLQVHVLLMLLKRDWMRDAVLRACALVGALFVLVLPATLGGVSGRHLLPAVGPLVVVSSTILASLGSRLRLGLLVFTFLANAGLLLATVASS